MRQRTRFLFIAILLVGALALPVGSSAAASPNGRIAFMRFDVTTGQQFIYTANPDGSKERRLLDFSAEHPRWSPDGTQLVVNTGCCTDFGVIVDVATGVTRALPTYPGLDAGCFVWAPDGQRLYCEATGSEDDSVNGIYSVRASDGGDLRRITTAPGTDPIPQDVSPDGAEVLFISEEDSDALFIANTASGAVRALDLQGLLSVASGSWSPDGQWIAFAARKAVGERRSLFAIRPDGTGMHEITLDPACGGAASDRSSRGCLEPTWSPDGSKLLLDILLASTSQKQLYTIDVDGSHLMKVTRHGLVRGDPGEGEQAPDWGTQPLE